MKAELFQFQKNAVGSLRKQVALALGEYQVTEDTQVVSFTAPTGAGKTIMMAALIERIFSGDERYPDQHDAIFVWLSDSPQLNEQSKLKIDLKSDRIRLEQCVTVQEDSFDQELLEDGHIYFLNTQKLGKSSNLTKRGDQRNHTIWETLTNTVREKGDRLYFIIDEAHRGAQGKEAGRATTIMQKFIKGSEEVPAMPVVIGMSATMERFNKLVADIKKLTVRKCDVTVEEVRSSGLLKDRILLAHPKDTIGCNEMAVLQAATDDWKEKWEHWAAYCREQHYDNVNPVFIVQVQSAKGDKISETDLDTCLQKISERSGFHFEEGEVVHTFGQTTASISVNGLAVRYEEPSRIFDDSKIKVVFFKENLSTGWDCPRAETMVSFRHAVDSTYIAQLLGRMIRTPLQMRIEADEVLNTVKLYLPYFDEGTVKQVVDALQSAEGGEIPADIGSEIIDNKKTVATLTVNTRPTTRHSPPVEQKTDPLSDLELFNPNNNTSNSTTTEPVENKDSNKDSKDTTTVAPNTNRNDTPAQQTQETQQSTPATPETEGVLNRAKVVGAINKMALTTDRARGQNISQPSDYRVALFRMVHFLCQSGLYSDAVRDVRIDIVKMIREYVDELKNQGKYKELASQVKQFELVVQRVDIYGKPMEHYFTPDMLAATEEDIDRQLRLAENKLGNDGIGYEYGRQYEDKNDPSAFKIDVILFAAELKCLEKLSGYAKSKFYELKDRYRLEAAALKSDKIRKQFFDILSDSDPDSGQLFRLPETLSMFPYDEDGKEYEDHLFVEKETGTTRIALNSWEEATLEEERKRDDFVCWLRNVPRASWALGISYEYNGVTKTTYPDFISIRKGGPLGYVIEILEPHDPGRDDNLGKAKGFAKYAQKNPKIGSIQLIRMTKDASGKNRPKRLDMAKSAVQEKVLKATTPGELNNIFDDYASYE